MSLELDARQRAMLAEMGVRVWLPEGTSPAAATVPVAPVEAARDPTPEAAAAPMPVAPAAAPVAAVVRPPVPLAPTAPAASTPVPADRPATAGLGWNELRQAVSGCQACQLCNGRKNTVFGVGHEQARWMVVGEAPGENEDLQGEPFVGAAGQLLDNMLKSIGLNRRADGDAAVYIANVIKCRPPGNRNPDPQEVAMCLPYLQRQVELLKPQIIVAMGRFAAQALLHASVPDVHATPLGRLRGKTYEYLGVPVVVTYHPAYLLRSLADKSKAWADLCLALATVQRPSA